MWLIDSSIGRKLVMSITGLFLILFLIFHMSMNLVALIPTPEGQELSYYDQICEFLGANWYALVGTAVLAGGFVLHIVFAAILTLRNQKARPIAYSKQVNQPKVEKSSLNMMVLGGIVLGLLIMHLTHFWAKMQLPEVMGGEPASGSELIKATISSLPICLAYIAWFCALWFHLTHGFWSAFQTMGLNGKTWFPRLKCIANVFATIIFIGFTVVVIGGYIQSL